MVRSIRSPRQLSSQQEIEDFEQELVDQFGLSIHAGIRYTNVISHPDLSGNDQS